MSPDLERARREAEEAAANYQRAQQAERVANTPVLHWQLTESMEAVRGTFAQHAESMQMVVRLIGDGLATERSSTNAQIEQLSKSLTQMAQSMQQLQDFVIKRIKFADKQAQCRENAMVDAVKHFVGTTIIEREAGGLRHEWDGTRLRLETAPGVWGEWVDLRGRDGNAQPISASYLVQHLKKVLSLDGGGAYDGTPINGEQADDIVQGAGIDGGGAGSDYSGANVINGGRSLPYM